MAVSQETKDLITSRYLAGETNKSALAREYGVSARTVGRLTDEAVAAQVLANQVKDLMKDEWKPTVGDLVTGIEDNPYIFTNEGSASRVESVDDIGSGGFGWMTVRIIHSEGNESQVGTCWPVYAKYFTKIGEAHAIQTELEAVEDTSIMPMDVEESLTEEDFEGVSEVLATIPYSEEEYHVSLKGRRVLIHPEEASEKFGYEGEGDLIGVVVSDCDDAEPRIEVVLDGDTITSYIEADPAFSNFSVSGFLLIDEETPEKAPEGATTEVVSGNEMGCIFNIGDTIVGKEGQLNTYLYTGSGSTCKVVGVLSKDTVVVLVTSSPAGSAVPKTTTEFTVSVSAFYLKGVDEVEDEVSAGVLKTTPYSREEYYTNLEGRKVVLHLKESEKFDQDGEENLIGTVVSDCEDAMPRVEVMVDGFGTTVYVSADPADTSYGESGFLLLEEDTVEEVPERPLFKVGDQVIGNEKNTYTLTAKGKRCEVTQSEVDGSMEVRLVDHTGPVGYEDLFIVSAREFDLVEESDTESELDCAFKVGDLITGNDKNKYSDTNEDSICEVVETGDFGHGEDLRIKIISCAKEYVIGKSCCVASKYFKLCEEAPKVHFTLTEMAVALTVDGVVQVIDYTHPTFAEVRQLIVDGNYAEASLKMDMKKAIESYSGGRLKIEKGVVVFDGREISNKLADKMINLMGEGDEGFKGFAKFFELVMENPSLKTRERLMDFVAAEDIGLNLDGHIVAFKNVKDDFKPSRKGSWKEVEGVWVYDANEYYNNSVGQSPAMPRTEVDDDESNTCSRGLHVCSVQYLKSFWGTSGRTVKVSIHPADVVAIPPDYNNSKARTCKYTVLEDVTGSLDEYLGKVL